MYQLITANIMNWLNLASRYNYKQNYYHAMLLDPPYHLTSITKRFSKGKAAKYGADGVYQRASKGFMNEIWDGGDLAFNPELWAALKDMLLPGAFCFAFAGSRGWHRMAIAIEDAGFIMHPTLFLWAFGSGFPKATNISRQLQIQRHGWGGKAISNQTMLEMPLQKRYEILYHEKANRSHRYGGQAIKPAVEPILCFQKPYEGRPLDNITETGAGALNIDRGRIGTDDSLDGGGYMTPASEGWDRPYRHNDDIREEKEQLLKQNVAHAQELGRWPSNLLLQHSPRCKKAGVKRVKGITGGKNPHKKPARIFSEKRNRPHFHHVDSSGLETIDDWQCVDDCPVKKLGEQSDESISRASEKINLTPNYKNKIYGKGMGGPTHSDNQYTDSGTAARFFYQSHYAYEIYEKIAAADPVRYVAKAGNKERNAGLDRLPNQTRYRVNAGGLENEPRWSPIETKNIHPTVKPIALTKYLASLLLPPEAYAPRRLLIPFAGSGSEICGAILSGQWEEIMGIEMTKKYIEIAKARCEFWSSVAEKVRLFGLDSILKNHGKTDTEIPDSQLHLPF